MMWIVIRLDKNDLVYQSNEEKLQYRNRYFKNPVIG